MNINILIVLYKKSLNDSVAYNTLINKNIRIIIWNNSPEIQFDTDNIEIMKQKI